MSYYIENTEEIKINNCTEKTAFVVKMLAKYIQNFETGIGLGDYTIFDAKLKVGEKELELKDFSSEDYNSYCKNLPEDGNYLIAPFDDNPSPYHAFQNWALVAPHCKESIVFRINYQCCCRCGADMGYDFWYDLFNAVDCAEIRELVEYRCLETYDCEQDTVIAFKYGVNGPEYVESAEPVDSIKPDSSWELEANSSICYFDIEKDDILEKADAEKIIEEITPLLEKYELSTEEFDELNGSIDIDGYVFSDGAKIPEILEDFQKLFDVIKPYKLALCGYTCCMVCREYDNLGAIVFKVDEDYKLHYKYLRIN